MGSDGINNCNTGDLFTIFFWIWWSQKQNQNFSSFGGCLLEKSQHGVATPDLVLYIRDNYPTWNPEDKRYIDLDRSGW